MTTSSSSSSAGEGTDSVPSPAEVCAPAGRRRRRLALIIGGLVLALALAGGVDLAVLSHRPQRVDIALPAPSAQATGPARETWLVLGVDSRATVPAGPNNYGTTAEVEGSRADIIALVQPTDTGLSVLVLPRELTTRTPDGGLERLAASYLQGPQYTVDLLCYGLGVTTTHLVTIDMAQFAAIIDSLGDVEVEVPEPVRDSYSGLDLPQAGRLRLTGVQALALVRSRHPEVLREGAWTLLDEAEGQQRRSEFTATVMRAVVDSLSTSAHNPFTARARAHAIAGNLTLDEGTGLLDLASLARAASRARKDSGIEMESLPLVSQDAGLMAFADERTHEILARHGYTSGACTPAS